MFYVFFLLFGFTFLSPHTIFADQQLVVNEFVVHPSSGKNEWLEFFVPDGTSLTGYWLDDDTNFTSDSGNSKKIALDTATMGSDKNHFVMELRTSMFNNSGDVVVLFNANGDVLDQYTYSADPKEDISLGRTPDGTGQIQLLANATKGSQNSTPKPTETPTPEPTSKPTKQPTATAQPTVIKAKASPTSIPIVDSPHVIVGEKVALSASNSAYPTAVLGVKTAITPPKLPLNPTGVMMVKGVSNFGTFVAFFAGFILLCCAILVYFRAWIMKVILKR